MKKLLSVILILVLILPAATMAAAPDPIVGAWYLSLDYRETSTDDPFMAGKKYMVYILIFDESGTIYSMVAEANQSYGFYGSCSTAGAWVQAGGTYTASLSNIGTCNPTIENERLIIRITENIWYSMRRLELGSWTDDLIYRE